MTADSNYIPSSPSLPPRMIMGADTNNASSSPLPSKNQIDPHHRTLSRHQSSNSCYSSQSFASNATGSSTKTHRRVKVEVGSLLFTQPSPGGYTTTTTASERRGPTDSVDQMVVRSSPSCCSSSRIRVSSSVDTLEYTTERNSTKESKQQQQQQGHFSVVPNNSNNNGSEEAKKIHQVDALQLIRELSFFDITSVPQRTFTATSDVSSKDDASLLLCSAEKEEVGASSSSPTPNEVSIDGSTSMNDDGSIDNGSSIIHDDEPVLPLENSELPPRAPLSPPTINRITDVPCQIMHNRIRTRSTSISEMSGSYFNEFMLDDDNNDADEEEEESSSNKSGGEKKSLITIDNNDVLVSSSRPVPLWNGARASTIGSEQSSYFSSTSSDASNDDDGLSIESHEEEDDEIIILMKDNLQEEGLENLTTALFHQETTGHSSFQDGKCNTYHHHIDDGSSSADMDEPSVPRLDSETLRKWDIMCEGEEGPVDRGFNTKDQLIFRALSCPHKMNDDQHSPGRGGSSCMNNKHHQPMQEEEGEEDNDHDIASVEEEEPHLMAGTSQAFISQSMFSYTNSCAASTISSSQHNNNKNHCLDEVISDLDFDMGFIYSFSIEKSSVVSGTHPTMDVGGGGGGTTTTTTTDRLNKSQHRRSLSSGSRGRLGNKPLATVLLQHQEDATLTKSSIHHRHRRFKSDGSIFCNKKKSSILSQEVVDDFNDFSFSSLTEEQQPLSFKSSSSSTKFRSSSCHHHRGKSLGSFKEPVIFDCSPLQCILEDEATSKSSHHSSSDELLLSRSSIVGPLVGVLKRRLESLSATSVLELGFVMGLCFGLLIPYALKV